MGSQKPAGKLWHASQDPGWKLVGEGKGSIKLGDSLYLAALVSAELWLQESLIQMSE